MILFRPAMCRRTFEAAWIKLSGLRPQGPEVMKTNAKVYVMVDAEGRLKLGHAE